MLEAPHLGADLDDHARAFAADGVGQRRLVEARAGVDVDEVEADRGVTADLDLAGAGLADLDVLELPSSPGRRFRASKSTWTSEILPLQAATAERPLLARRRV